MLSNVTFLGPSGPGIGTQFDAVLAQQERLCEALESLADSLPAQVDTYAALELTRKLRPTLRRCHAFEETMVYPLLLTTQRDLTPTLRRLRAEHMEDADHAGDIHDAIKLLVTRRTAANPETTGYMLRALFVAMRRHVALERDFLLPIVKGMERA